LASTVPSANPNGTGQRHQDTRQFGRHWPKSVAAHDHGKAGERHYQRRAAQHGRPLAEHRPGKSEGQTGMV